MEWPDIIKIAAASSGGVGLVGLTIGLAFRALDKSSGALIEDVAGEYQVPSSEIKSILEQFKSDESRLKALELLLKVPRERAKDVLDRVKDAAPSVRRMYQQRSRYSLRVGGFAIFFSIIALLLPRERGINDTVTPAATNASPANPVTNK